MRKITRLAYNAFINNKRISLSNTDVQVHNGITYLFLFNNNIIKKENEEIFINHCKHITATTQERLSAFVNIRRKKGEFILNEKCIMKDGWTNIKDI